MNSQLPTMRDLFLDIQKEYLEDETNHWIAIVTILSGFLAILEVILSIASIQEATLYNFYLPLMSAILLLAVIFHKNHERMIFKKEKQKELGAFMYHCYQQKDLYAYACDGLTLEEKNQIQKDFQLE